MNAREKKISVLNQLNLENSPISLKDLHLKLKGEFAERSLRRWLTELVSEGLVEKLGAKKATCYRGIQPKQSLAAGRPFSDKSLKIIERISRPIYERVPISYSEKWLDSYIPNITHYIPIDSLKKLHAAGERSKKEDPAGTYAHQIFNRLLIDLSYNSSRLEGNTYSLLDTERLLMAGETPEGKLDDEKVMILNHKEAIRYLVDTAPRITISKETICTLHYLLADGLVEARHAGKIRDHGVRISGSTYMPFEDPAKLQQVLQKISEKAALIEDPFEQSFFLLIHISYLQAFSDVNKRTARLCSNISLIRNNLVPLSFNDVDRQDYSSALISVYELQEIQPILDLYLYSYIRTCAVYDSTVKAMGFDEVRVRYRQQRRTLLRTIILNKLIGADLKNYVFTQSLKLINEKDRAEFCKDLEEDLEELDESRLAGLGVTLEELQGWINQR